MCVDRLIYICILNPHNVYKADKYCHVGNLQMHELKHKGEELLKARKRGSE